MTKAKIIWTKIDEAPALASYALLPIVQAFTRGTGIEVETSDISLAGRIIANFPEKLTEAQRVGDHLARLGELHVEVEAWLAPLVAGLPRLGRYGQRLGAAASAATAGDGRYIASPRVDSYHGAWFELHEDLIQLAGRTRADEVAAGRA